MSVKSRRACALLALVCLLLTGGCTRAKPPLDIVSELTGLVTGAEETPAVPVDGNPSTAPSVTAAQTTAAQPTVTRPSAPQATTLPGQPTPTITPWPTFTPFPMSDSTPLAVLTPATLVPASPALTLEPTPAGAPGPTLVPTLVIVPTVLIVDATPTISATEVITQDTTYVVAAGDTLLSISQHYGTSVDAIANRNGLVSKNAIYAGQELVIPAGYGPDDAPPPMVVSHTVAKGETLSTIGRMYRTTSSEIIAQNQGVISDPNNLAPGTVLSITVGTAPVQVVHTVRAGDTLASIARRYGVTVQALVEANAIRNPNRVPIGRVLLIPQ